MASTSSDHSEPSVILVENPGSPNPNPPPGVVQWLTDSHPFCKAHTYPSPLVNVPRNADPDPNDEMEPGADFTDFVKRPARTNAHPGPRRNTTATLNRQPPPVMPVIVISSDEDDHDDDKRGKFFLALFFPLAISTLQALPCVAQTP